VAEPVAVQVDVFRVENVPVFLGEFKAKLVAVVCVDDLVAVQDEESVVREVLQMVV
jgi:hypothetical protein